jgi:hypothetical protein
MSSPPVTEVEKNIRALTTAIHLVQPQSAVTVTPIPAKQHRDQALSKAYNHLATLLTQGSEAEDGSSTGRQVVAVTGSSNTSGFSVVAFQEIEDLDNLPSVWNFASTQNFDIDGVLLKVEEIKPSGKTLEDLDDPSKTYAC